MSIPTKPESAASPWASASSNSATRVRRLVILASIAICAVGSAGVALAIDTKPEAQFPPWLLALIGLATAAIAPVTAAVVESFKLQQTNKIEQSKLDMARLEQRHKISSEHLDRALRVDSPLATRQQVLRFLALGDDEKRLQKWAEEELKQVSRTVDVLERPMKKAEEAVKAAGSPEELAKAEAAFARLRLSIDRKLAEPPRPDVSPAALRAGLFRQDESGALRGKEMAGWDLRGADVGGSDMVGVDLSNADLTGANLRSAKLRGARLVGALCDGTSFGRADLRVADLTDADLRGADLQGTRLEGAILTGARFRAQTEWTADRNGLLSKTDARAIYDSATQWPDGFEPAAWGAVPVDVSETKPAGMPPEKESSHS